MDAEIEGISSRTLHFGQKHEQNLKPFRAADGGAVTNGLTECRDGLIRFILGCVNMHPGGGIHAT